MRRTTETTPAAIEQACFWIGNGQRRGGPCCLAPLAQQSAVWHLRRLEVPGGRADTGEVSQASRLLWRARSARTVLSVLTMADCNNKGLLRNGFVGMSMIDGFCAGGRLDEPLPRTCSGRGGAGGAGWDIIAGGALGAVNLGCWWRKAGDAEAAT